MRDSLMKTLEFDGFRPYQVSDSGTVYAPHLHKSLKPYDNGLGYLAVKLRKTDGTRVQFYIHRLVASAYLENVDNLPDINHKDGDKTNNTVENLEWVSKTDNSKHAFSNKLLRGFVTKYM